MRNNKLGLSVAVAAILISAALGPAQAGIKCWTNSEGVRECGNVVPPEYAQQGHEEVSEQGITTKKTARAKTAEEMEAAREVERQQAEIERLEREQQNKDHVLLATFTTEDDLILARDGKLRAIDTRIQHTQQIAGNLEENLKQLEAEAALQERSGQEVPESLLNQIAETQDQIGENRMFIEDRNKEKENLAQKFDADLTRYRELKGN